MRPFIRALHRDLGYLVCPLTVLYALSGLAVNHVADWNPHRYRFEREVEVGPLSGSLDAMETQVIAALDLTAGSVKGRRLGDDGQFIVYLRPNDEIAVATATGRGQHTGLRERPVIQPANVLHLNDLKGLWTYVADGYAVALLVLALTGLFMLKGRTGLAGRGKWLLAAGTLLPLGFLAYYYFFSKPA